MRAPRLWDAKNSQGRDVRGFALGWCGRILSAATLFCIPLSGCQTDLTAGPSRLLILSDAQVDAEVDAALDAGLDPEPSANPEPSTNPEPSANPEPGANPEPMPDPEPNPMPDPEPNPMPDPEPNPMPDPEPNPQPDPEPDPDLPPDPGLNAGWIGGPCAQDADCDYPEAFCLTEDDGYPRGTCSLGCDRICPDRDGMPVTFCVDDVIVGSGACMQRCDYDAFATGCRPGYHCEARRRFGEPDTRRGICVPGEPEPDPNAGCYELLDERNMNYQRAANPMDSPNGRPDLTCDINAPLTLNSPINGVRYMPYNRDEPRGMFVSCDLALALWDLSALLREYDIVDVGHIGTYNCRVISGTDELSQHGHAAAIDLMWFRRADGHTYNVEDHWEHDTANPQSERARVLYEIGQQMHARRIFNIVLTPNFNAAHDNHFHVDLTGGAHYIGKGDGPACYIGPNPHGD